MSSLFTKTVFLRSVVIAILYILLSTYLMNLSLVLNTILGGYPLSYKFNLLFTLLGGMWTAMTHVGLVILVLTGFFSGLNISIIFAKIKVLGGVRNAHIIAGGSSILGIVGAGCAACGLPVLSLLGLSASFMSLPFHGAEISYLSLSLLVFSLYILIRQNNSRNECRIP